MKGTTNAMSSPLRLRTVLALLLVGVPLASFAEAAPSEPAQKPLRVCADPANLPLSNERGEGFENAVAAHVAKAMGRRLETTWWSQRRGFFRHTLGANACDVVLTVPVGLDAVRTTKPYFRSTFAFVTRKDENLGDLRSFDDPRLRSLRIGVPLAGDDGANPAPVHALARRGIRDNIRGFPLYGELGRDVPAIVDAVARGELDVGIAWGPVVGAGAKRSPANSELVVVPVAERTDGGVPVAFAMAMGVRKKDAELAKELDAVLARERGAIAHLLEERGVPLLPLDENEVTEGDRDAR